MTYQPIKEGVSTFLDIRGKKYHLKIWGQSDAPKLFYLHGWADTGTTFQFVVDKMRSNWQIIAPDWRGFGKTEHQNSSYWFPDYLADLDFILETYSPDETVIIMGHSMGANIASLYAGIKPERVNQLINIEGFGLSDSDPNNAPDTYRRWLQKQESAPTFNGYSSYDELIPKITKRNPSMKLDRAAFVAREWAYEDSNGHISLRADPYHKLPNAVQYRRLEAEACWKNIIARTLLIWGEHTNFKKEMDLLKKTTSANHPFTQAKCVCVSNTGHMIHFENPESLAAILDDFLSSD
ncbi:MAG: alpha/beta hydrolase [Woeseiaceae bacterium]|nr:alpha/beta hydrolase [Woeseiaceae bacterium]MDG1015582.1 alpha/beta hydrolase [Woeseiaceae bacterium]MDG1713598.1 alpha/beta hydrolase [Woeseiaceae bacterium]MDG1864723.1 alpha/beta hydrolase [Woeseiaceae bacterium]